MELHNKGKIEPDAQSDNDNTQEQLLGNHNQIIINTMDLMPQQNRKPHDREDPNMPRKNMSKKVHVLGHNQNSNSLLLNSNERIAMSQNQIGNGIINQAGSNSSDGRKIKHVSQHNLGESNARNLESVVSRSQNSQPSIVGIKKQLISHSGAEKTKFFKSEVKDISNLDTVIAVPQNHADVRGYAQLINQQMLPRYDPPTMTREKIIPYKDYKKKDFELWKKMQEEIGYAQETVDSLSSIKDIFKKRVQFNEAAKKIKAKLEKNTVDYKQREGHNKLIISVQQQATGKQKHNSYEQADEQNDEGLFGWTKFIMAMYEEHLHRVKDEYTFWVHNKYVRFSKNSLGILNNKTKLRYILVYVCTSKWFEYLIISMILLNSLFLGIKDYTDKDNVSDINQFVESIEPLFTYIFLMECTTKIMAQGWILGRNSYLSDSWNWLDFIVVVTSLMQQLPSMQNMSGLRTFRLFRPLRSLTTMPSMKVLIGTLLSSVSQLGGIMGLALFFFMIFAILGVSLWNGSIHYRCYQTEWPTPDGFWELMPNDTKLCGNSSRECPSGGFCSSRYVAFDAGYNLIEDQLGLDTDINELNYGITNFDNIFSALMTIFQCITMEGWTKIMNIYEDASTAWFVNMYFILCVVINSFFLLNLTIAVMLMKYEELDKNQSANSKHQEELKQIGQEIKLPIALTHFLIQQDSIQIQSGAGKMLKDEDSFIKQLFAKKQAQVDTRLPYYQKPIVKICHSIIMNSYFDAFIIVVIIVNTFALALDKYPPQSDAILDFLNTLNLVFTIIFTVEVVFKMIGLGAREFSKEKFNQFDLLIVIISIVQLQFNSTDGPSIFSSLRAFRLFKIFRLFRVGDLRILLDSITFTLTTIGDYVILLLLFIYVFALLGMSFFAGEIKITDDDRVDPINGTPPRENFDGPVWSVITIFEVLLGEGWNEIMFQNIRCIGMISAIYFVALVTLGNIIMLNLFLAILLGNFDKARNFGQKKKVFEAFKEILFCGSDLNEALDVILGDMSIHVKTKILKWDALQVQKMHAVGDSKIGMSLLEEGAKFMNNSSSIQHDNLAERRIQSQADEDVDKYSGDQNSPRKGDKTQVRKRSTNEADVKKNDNESSMRKETNKMSLKKQQKYAKTVEKYHKTNPKLMRLRELNRQFRIKPFPGLQEILRKKNLEKIVIKNTKQEKEGEEEFEDKQKESSMNHKLSSSSFRGRMSRKTSKNKLLESDSKINSGSKIVIRNQGRKDFFESQAQNDFARISRKSTGQLPDMREHTQDPEQLTPKQRYLKYMRNSSLFIFHRDFKIRRLCLILSESPENLNLLYEMEQQGQLDGYNSDGSNASINSVEEEKKKEKQKELKTQQKANLLFGIDNKGKEAQKVNNPNKIFDGTVVALIIMSSIMLVIDNPLYDPKSQFVIWLSRIDILFTILFFFEAMIKIIAKGAVQNNLGPIKPYLKSYWNMLDFFVVSASMIDLYMAIMGFDANSLQALKSLRALRALRPLRMISRNDGMRLVVNALLASLPSMTNVLLVCSLFILIFAIMGVNFFKGMYYKCHDKPWRGIEIDMNTIITKKDCLAAGGEWKQEDSNFDNTISAMNTLFQMTTTEGWVNVMYDGVDAVCLDMQPKQNSSVWLSLYFIAFMIVGSQFIINLFVGVVIDNFNTIKEKEELGNMFVTEQQRSWIEIQKIGQGKRLKVKINEPNNYQRPFYRLVNTKIFEYIITMFILLNTILMAMKYYRMSNELEEFSEQANYVFSFVFNMEMIFKLIGLGKLYFIYPWNNFDMVIVFATDLGLLFKFFAPNAAGFSSTASVIRGFRIMRMFKLIRSSVHMRLILDTVFNIMPQISNVMSLILLLFFIYAALGINLFSGVMQQDQLDDKNNFENFPNAMIILMKFSTGEDWNAYMYELAHSDGYNDVQCLEMQTYEDLVKNNGVKLGCGSWVAYPFFLSFTIIVSMLIMNLSVAAVIEGLDTAKKENMGIVEGDEIERLIEHWQDYDPHATGWITMTDLVFLLYELPPPLGKRSNNMPMDSTMLDDDGGQKKGGLRQQDRYLYNSEKKIVMKKIDALHLLRDLKIKVHSDVEKQVHFVDVFKALLKRIFTDKNIDYKLSPNLNKKIKNQWTKKHKNATDLKCEFSAREQQAGLIIIRWWKRQQQNIHKNIYKKVEKKNKSNLKQGDKSENNKIDRSNMQKQDLIESSKIVYNLVKNGQLQKVSSTERLSDECDNTKIQGEDEDELQNYGKTKSHYNYPIKQKNEYTWKTQGGHILLEELEGTLDSNDSADFQETKKMTSVVSGLDGLSNLEKIDQLKQKFSLNNQIERNYDNSLFGPYGYKKEVIEATGRSKPLNSNEIKEEEHESDGVDLSGSNKGDTLSPKNKRKVKRHVSAKNVIREASAIKMQLFGEKYKKNLQERKAEHLHIKIGELNNDNEKIEMRRVYSVHELGMKPQRDLEHETTEKVLLRKVQKENAYLEDINYMPNKKYNIDQTRIKKQEYKAQQKKQSEQQKKKNKEDRELPSFNRFSETFVQGGNQDTIEMDKRFADDSQYQDLMKKKANAERKGNHNALDQMHLEELKFNTQNYLQVEQKAPLDLVGPTNKEYMPSKATVSSSANFADGLLQALPQVQASRDRTGMQSVATNPLKQLTENERAQINNTPGAKGAPNLKDEMKRVVSNNFVEQ